MANLPRRWSPAFAGLEQLRREFDDLYERVLGRPVLAPDFTQIGAPAIESYVDKGTLVVRTDLPGVDPKDVEISVVGNNLVIRGHRESKHEEKTRDFYHREISYGAFRRSVPLPVGVKADQIKASYKDGVLELTAALPKEAEHRKIPITTETKPAAKSDTAATRKK
jgi:HSP20 family protein